MLYRSDAGDWTDDTVGAFRHTLTEQTSPVRKRVLIDPAVAAELDRLIAERCAFDEPLTFVPSATPSPDTIGWAMEIVSPTRTRIAYGFGRPAGGITANLWDIAVADR